MHELSLLAGLFRQVERIADAERATRVTCVRLRLGALAHISPEHLREHFVDAARGTRLEGARLEVTTATDPTDGGALDILLESVDVE